jgi:hypothetical protein
VAPECVRDRDDRLGQVRRAGDVGEQAARSQQRDRGVEQLALQLGERRQVGRLPPPARLRRPLHGASSSTRSAQPSASGGRRASAVTTCGSPARATSRERWCCSSNASSRAPRSRASVSSSAAFPPGPAHRSTQMRSGPSSGASASASATSWLPSSWTPARPSRTAGMSPGSPSERRTANGDQGPAVPPLDATRASRPIRRATRCTSGRASSAASARPVSSTSPPSASRKAEAIQRGWLCRNASAATGSSAGSSSASQVSRSLALTLRSTALTNPTGPALRMRRARSTVALTAAWVGTRIRRIWCAPSRSRSRTGGSTWSSGRSTQACRTAS